MSVVLSLEDGGASVLVQQLMDFYGIRANPNMPQENLLFSKIRNKGMAERLQYRELKVTTILHVDKTAAEVKKLNQQYAETIVIIEKQNTETIVIIEKQSAETIVIIENTQWHSFSPYSFTIFVKY